MLAEAVESVIKQTQKSLEIIIIDDCSSDGTEDFVKSFTDERIKYFRNEHNIGLERNRQFGLRQAKGKYITFLDDDDYYTDYDFFANAVKIFEEYDNETIPLAFVCANAVLFNVETQKKNLLNIGQPGRGNGIDFVLAKEYGKPPSTFPTLFKADILRRAGLENMGMFDTATYLQAALFGDIYIMPGIIGVYRVHGNSITRSYQKYGAGPERLYAKLINSAQRNILIAKELYSRADTRTVDQWYIKKTLSIPSYYREKCNSVLFSLRVKKELLRLSSFKLRLAVIIAVKMLVQSLRYQVRKITPLRKLYRFIKYRLRGKSYPED